VVENLRFDTWVIDSPLKDGILVTNYYVKIPEEPVSERTPVFRNISISNVTVTAAPVVADIQGLPEMPIESLRIRDLTGSGKRGVQVFNTRALELRDVKIAAEQGPAFLVRDSSQLQLDRVESEENSDSVPVIRLDRITGATVQGSRASLSVAPGSLKSITADPNVRALESSTDYWLGIDSPDREVRKQ
jgi:hypothetical protein